MSSGLYGFLFAMWSLIIIGGGIMVVLLGPFTIQQFGDFHWILASGPLTEKQIGFAIFKLTIFSGILAIITAFMMGVSL